MAEVDLFAEKHLTNENANEVKAASVSGNIVIIFVVWVVGVGVAIICGLVECTCAVCFNKLRPLEVLAYFKMLTGIMWVSGCRLQ